MIGFPLLLIPFAIYNIFVFLMPGVAFTSPVISVALMSGVTWTPTFGDALLALGLFLLLLEVIKASRPGARYLTDHLLSLIVLGAAIAEFLLLAPFVTSTFFLLTVLMAVEFLAGVSIGFRNRKRHVQPAAPAAVAREPAPIVATPARVEPDVVPASARLAPTEPSFERTYPDAAAVEPAFERAPEPHVQSEPRIEPELEPVKPVPSLAVIRSPETPDPAPAPAAAPARNANPERKIANWSVADLLSDHDSEAGTKIPPKP